MKNYLVEQSNLSANGSEESWKVAEYNNLRDALEFANSIKEDMKGIHKLPHGCLQTIVSQYNREDDNYTTLQVYEHHYSSR